MGAGTVRPVGSSVQRREDAATIGVARELLCSNGKAPTTVWHCPSPDCPHRRKHGRAADYTTKRDTCADCATTLVQGEGPAPADALRVPASLYLRVAVTLGLPALAWAVGQIPLPFHSVLGESLYIRDVTAGLVPFVTGFFVVEVIAAIVPRWRWLRVSGPHGRKTLDRWSYVVGGVVALIQIWGLLTYLASQGTLVGAREQFLFVAGSAVLSLGLVVLARVIQKWGVANGFAVLLTAELVSDLLSSTQQAPTALEHEPSPFAAYAVLAATIVATGLLLEHRRANPRKGALWLQTPLSGVIPILLASSLLLLPSTLVNLGLDLRALIDLLEPGTAVFAAADGLVIAALTVLLALLFNRPSRVSRLLGDTSVDDAKRRIWLALPWTLLFTVCIGVVPTLLVQVTHRYVGGYLVVFLVAAVLDGYHECRARIRHPELVSVWPEHRLYAVGVLMSALDEAGIPAHARATRYRALLQFFGPHVPVEILVPRAHAARAAQVIEDRLLLAEG